MDLTRLYCDVDDFVKELPSTNPHIVFNKQKKKKRGFPPKMSLSEIMTIIIYYHASGFKNFKTFYLNIPLLFPKAFSPLLSYSRFIEWMPCCAIPLVAYLHSRRGKNTGINFVDSTPIKICHNKRISRNKVFQGLASRGRSSMGWFYGFKLHIVVNELGDLISFKLTKANTDDRVPVKELCRYSSGKLYGDRGYIGKKLFEELFQMGIHLVTNIRSNMKNRLLPLYDKMMLRKRFIIETINDQLKNISDIEHTRHRSPTNFMVNIISGLIAYTWQARRPSIRNDHPIKNLAV